ncbi:hypothetical protein LSTR_LSTR007521 [Laodelphax striatellus]|uniref:Uncharacterized protein n=1 Tax=Laodelphax striatellus TaxID=195883 RepID=A0A482XRP7_LAOST|nr:hypothetical protein LSTR_LSTR007521 [Laodelphax striatellus]
MSCCYSRDCCNSCCDKLHTAPKSRDSTPENISIKIKSNLHELQETKLIDDYGPCCPSCCPVSKKLEENEKVSSASKLPSNKTEKINEESDGSDVVKELTNDLPVYDSQNHLLGYIKKSSQVRCKSYNLTMNTQNENLSEPMDKEDICSMASCNRANKAYRSLLSRPRWTIKARFNASIQ